MTIRGFVCSICQSHTSSKYQQYSERIEIRRIDGQDRPYSHTIRYLCKDCVSKRIQQVEGLVGAPSQQGSML